MSNLQAEKNELRNYLKHAAVRAAHGVEETNRKRIMGVLAQRQGDALDVLDCVKARVKTPGAFIEGKPALTLERVFSSPVIAVLLALGAIVFTLVTALSAPAVPADAAAPAPVNLRWLSVLLFALLILGQAVYCLVVRAKAASPDRKALEAEAVLSLDEERAKVLVDKQVSRILVDAEAISDMFCSQQLDGMNAYEDELVKLFISLYEARVDRPDCEEFSYSLTMAEMMLRQIGLKAVPYSEEQKKLFNIEREDYHNEMRYPAVVREKTGEVVRKGEYIQSI